jgi:hypothetical protein
MILKSADDKSSEVAALRELRRHPGASAEVRQKIASTLHNIVTGIEGEAESAARINFRYGRGSKQWMVIHDLRIIVDGRVAQMDHVLLNRLGEIFVCESKVRQYGIRMNRFGEFSAIRKDGSLVGMASPVQQNKRQIHVLKKWVEAHQVKPRNLLGLTIDLWVLGLVLVSSNTRIDRPENGFSGLETIFKNDQFENGIWASVPALQGGHLTFKKPLQMIIGALGALGLFFRVMSQEELERLARQLLAQHRPTSTDWYAKFNLPRGVELEPEGVLSLQRGEVTLPTRCQSCDGRMSAREANYCLAQPQIFCGKCFCMGCQNKVRGTLG